jgi:SAM-dependent methyltransferase
MSQPNLTTDYNAFDPRVYLNEYYSTVPEESLALLEFLVTAFQQVPLGSRTLDFGGGPTLYTEVAAAARTQEIHYSDYLAANRAEMQQWLAADADAFDWSETIRVVLELEDRLQQPPFSGFQLRQPITPAEISTREARIRQSVTRILHCDATLPLPIAEAEPYDVLVTNLCIEAAARDVSHWQECLAQVLSLLKPGGHLIMSTVIGGTAYPVGGHVFPVVSLQSNEVRTRLIELGFPAEAMQTVFQPATHPVHPYEGLLFTHAVKSNAWVGRD